MECRGKRIGITVRVTVTVTSPATSGKGTPCLRGGIYGLVAATSARVAYEYLLDIVLFTMVLVTYCILYCIVSITH